MKKFLSVLLVMLMFCSCVPAYEKIDFVEGIHYPYPMTIRYNDASYKISGAASSWDFPGNEEYGSYAVEAVLEHPLENKDIFSFSAGAEKTAKLVFSEGILTYEVRRWKVEADYLEDETAGHELDNESEKVKTEDGVFEISDDSGIYVYEVHACYEYGDCYYWFRIDPADEWGITISVKNVTSTGATLVFSQSGGNPAGELMTGSYYLIERDNKELEYIVEGDISWTAESYTIPKDDKLEMNVNWEGLYGTLEPGTYQIAKLVMDHGEPGNLVKYYYAEFTVGEKKKYSVSNMKIVDGAESGNLVLAGEETGNVMTLDVKDIPVFLDGKPAEPSVLMDGMTAEIRHEGVINQTYPSSFSSVYEIHVYSLGTKNQPGGTYFDLCGLYLKVLEDIWAADSGLNGGAEYVSIDFSKAPGGLTEGEKSAVSWIFANKTGVMAMNFTMDELKSKGYLTAAEGSNNLYQWDNGVLITITGDPDENSDSAYSLPVLRFEAMKWRSPLGAYFFMDCNAVWPEAGTWTDYNVGAHAIS